MPRSSMVEMETASLEKVEKDKWSGPHPQRFKIYRWEDMVAGEVSTFTGKCRRFVGICPAQHGWVASCSKPWKLETVFANVKRALCRWSRVPRGPMCVRHDWDGCKCCMVDKEKKRERKVWRALGTPSMCIKPNVTLLRGL